MQSNKMIKTKAQEKGRACLERQSMFRNKKNINSCDMLLDQWLQKKSLLWEKQRYVFFFILSSCGEYWNVRNNKSIF